MRRRSVVKRVAVGAVAAVAVLLLGLWVVSFNEAHDEVLGEVDAMTPRSAQFVAPGEVIGTSQDLQGGEFVQPAGVESVPGNAVMVRYDVLVEGRVGSLVAPAGLVVIGDTVWVRAPSETGWDRLEVGAGFLAERTRGLW